MINWRPGAKIVAKIPGKHCADEAEFMERKRILITGGTGALGSEIVRALSRSTPAFEVTANYHRDANRAEELHLETNCDLFCADVGDEAQVAQMFEKSSPLFAVIHAAGTAHDGLLLKQSRAMWNESLCINADAAFFIARAALQEPKNGGLANGGRLIFLASRVGEQGRAGQSSYAAGKAATVALMKCAAREGAMRKVAVNAVCPGFVLSDMNASLSTPHLDQARKSSITQQFGNASETAGLVQWLLSESAASISGQVFYCDNRL